MRACLADGRIDSSVRSRLPTVSGGFVDPARYAEAYDRYVRGEGAESTWSTISIVTPITFDYWARPVLS
jgi:hypothetical protein